jgi:hypothetical protein
MQNVFLGYYDPDIYAEKPANLQTVPYLYPCVYTFSILTTQGPEQHQKTTKQM